MLSIEVLPSGIVRILVDGQPIGLVEELQLLVAGQHDPRILVTMVDPKRFVFAPEDPTREWLENKVAEQRRLLQRCPFIDVLERADTLPSVK